MNSIDPNGAIQNKKFVNDVCNFFDLTIKLISDPFSKILVENGYTPSKYKEFINLFENVIKFIDNIILDYFNKYKNNEFINDNFDKSAFYKQLINNHDYKYILDGSFTFLSAGIDTTSVLMNNVLLIIAEHQDVQERLYNELKSVINNIDNITVDEIEKLT